MHEALDPWSMGGTGLILGYMSVVAVLKFFRESEYIPTEETELLPFVHEGPTSQGKIPYASTDNNHYSHKN